MHVCAGGGIGFFLVLGTCLQLFRPEKHNDSIQQETYLQAVESVVSAAYNTLQVKLKMAERTRERSSGHSRPKHRQECYSLQKVLEFLDLIDGDKSDLEDLSDNDNANPHHESKAAVTMRVVVMRNPFSTEDGKLCVVPEDTCQRWDKKLNQYVAVSRPSIVHEYNLKMGGVDLADRMISYYRMSARTKKWTMCMLMHFTDLVLANSWLLYCKDLTICGTPKNSIMQFLEFLMEVARTLLAQHHSQEDDGDLSELSEEEDNSKQVKNRPVAPVPHVSVRNIDENRPFNVVNNPNFYWGTQTALYSR
ncbi:Chimeric ERCC6-PGBD3 protein Chimeric CSB-PGBD3 protein [Channa argus]|uniref:Chimeric ERCC6-PGBD3 protein Chimeric CSB-PGBD3 protein n=1 Tax=Channa argus TaxID=215402 RepID=A0A6G1PT22_CHAAH|nr:Chimeric ERCC6-PGBD3 protein Chimeric CSB-PGBD3 protein [Channa argus]